MHGEGRKVLSHAAMYLIARGVPGIVAFLAIPLFSRLLSPEEYGHYTLVLAAVTLINALFFQWLRLAVVRYVYDEGDAERKIKSTMLSVSLLLVLGMGALTAVLAVMPFAHGWRGMLGVAWFVLAVQAVYDLACEYSRARLQPWRYMVLQLLRAFSFIGLGALLVTTGLSWWGPLLGVGVGMLLAVAWTYRKDWSDARLRIDGETLRKISQYGIPLSVTVALAVVIISSDRFLIDWYLGKAATGLYAVAVDFTVQTLMLLMMIIQMAVFPLAVRAWETEGRQAAQRQMHSNAALLLAVGLPCVVGMTVLAPGIVNCFFGEEFRQSATSIIPMIAIGTFLAGMKAYHFDAAFQFVHRTIHQVWIVLFVAIVNIILNVIAIPRWGINGAAAASMLAYFISIVLTVWYGRKYLVLPLPIKAFVQVSIACGLMAAALLPFRDRIGAPELALQVIAGAGLYAIALVAGNFIGLRETILRRLFNRSTTADDEKGIAEALDLPAGVSTGQLVETQ